MIRRINMDGMQRRDSKSKKTRKQKNVEKFWDWKIFVNQPKRSNIALKIRQVFIAWFTFDTFIPCAYTNLTYYIIVIRRNRNHTRQILLLFVAFVTSYNTCYVRVMDMGLHRTGNKIVCLNWPWIAFDDGT